MLEDFYLISSLKKDDKETTRSFNKFEKYFMNLKSGTYVKKLPILTFLPWLRESFYKKA
mgnify:CR=1 FL=1